MLDKIYHAVISIHALREEGDPLLFLESYLLSISIHALREEGDAWPTEAGESVRHFYPRPPRGGRLTNRRKSTPT